MVDWSLFKDKAGEYVNIRTAISCPFSCSFCGFPQHAGKYQAAPVDMIEAELKTLDKTGTVKHVYFIDDTFNTPVKRFKEILRMMIKNNFGFKWYSFFRCQFADDEMVELMKLSGCKGVHLGLESGNNQILKNMNKAVHVEEYYRGIELLKKYGLLTYGNFIIGFPGETAETVKDTVHFIETSGLDLFRAQLWYCEPITPIWKQKDRYQIRGESFEWSHELMDSQTACDLVETIFFTVENPTWVPQYNFDFDSVWHLLQRGMSIQQVCDLLKIFKLAVKEKLSGTSLTEVSYETLNKLKNACTNSKDDDGETFEAVESTIINTAEAEFVF
jgi:radical SAM PhpK family P-methyltransferase